MALANSRALAATILQKLVDGEGSLTGNLEPYRDRKDYGFVQELCFGSCRWYHLLQAIVGQLLERPLKERDGVVACLIMIGLYQLRESNKAAHAIVNETVAATEDLGRPWARGLINGILRNYQRQQKEIDSKLPTTAGYSHPSWLRKALQQQWPAQAETIMHNANQRPPMTLRCNSAHNNADELLQEFSRQGIAARKGQWASTALYLQEPMEVTSIPGFTDGRVSVQDEASQLVPGLLQLQPGLRVLDACAAPGGKTGHIGESEQSLTEIVAIDSEASRAQRIHENLARLHLKARVIVADARDTRSWWDGDHFDRILLDAPCSATGVIRRHPDIKLLRRPTDIARLNQLQAGLLDSLWPCLNPGGLLLYTSCSLLRQENEAIVGSFLEATGDAKYESIAADWGVECSYGRQLLTGNYYEPDGFYFALLRKSQG